MIKKLSNLPSIVYVVLIPIGIAALIVGVILLFTGIATIEGFASFLFLVIGLVIVLAGSSDVKIPKIKSPGSGGFAVAAGIVFFALMGMSIDQTGNVIYNYPIQVLSCPEGTYLTRESVVTNPLPGRTDINQDFNCVNTHKKVVSSVDIGTVLIVRFVEYVIIGYGFIFLGTIITFIKKQMSVADNQTI
ncbi:MAG: hypothetical protein ABIM99_00590 [Candidatus Dojkabacteria bacterium]